MKFQENWYLFIVLKKQYQNLVKLYKDVLLYT